MRITARGVRRVRRLLVYPLSGVLAAGTAASVLTAMPAAAAAATGTKPVTLTAPPHVKPDKVVPGHDVGAMAVKKPAAVKAFRAAAPVFPAAGTATVALDQAAGAGSATPAPKPGSGVASQTTAASPSPTLVRAGSSPVLLGAVAAPAGASRVGAAAALAPSKLVVHVFDHADAGKAGVSGLLFSVARADGVSAAGSVNVTVDFSAFKSAYGADYASRMQLVELTGCTSMTPVPTGCHMTPVRSANNAGAATVSATVAVGSGASAAPSSASAAKSSTAQAAATAQSGAVMMAATASASGGDGSFAATTLKPSGSWSVNGNSGDFTWSYPLHTPPSAGGPAPALSITYDSSSVDGEMAASNNQPSWLGEGFDLDPGFIERSYIPCSQDMGSGANNTSATGDMCWSTDNATLSLTSHSGELIQGANNSSRWYLRTDDGSFIEHLTGAGNGAQNGEYWRVTSTDGTQYFFGSTPSADSTLTEPVYGNNPGEPCHQSTFAASSCTQAYRWNLDKVVDPSGNVITYHYGVETNQYAADDNPSTPVSYDRASHLTEIDYGTTASSTGPAPMRVVFNTGNRCVTSSCSTHDATNWPDTPWDQQCTGSPCLNGSPTFWSTVMLNSISTQLYSGSGSTYNTIDTWQLTHTFPDPGDGTRAGLWLSSIQETGTDGGTSTSEPPVTFTPVQLQNRVDPIGLGLPPMNWNRLSQITTESGSEIEVSYSPIDCVPGSSMPNLSDLQDNTLRCYPVIWTPPGHTSPITDFFNKYVVTAVNTADLTTPSEPTTTVAYNYQGTPAWHFTDDNAAQPASTKTWSVWRGYGDVKVTTGTGSDATTTETTYFRGMNGDHLPSGTRSVQLPAVDMNNDGNTSDSVDMPAVNDDDALAGMTRSTTTFNGSAMVSQTVSDAFESAPVATRTDVGITVNSVMTGVADTRTETILDGGRAPRTTSTHTDYDPTYGDVVDVQDNGDDAVTGDETCTLTSYDRATSSDGSTWLIAFPSEVRKTATTCAVAQAGGLTAAQVDSDTLTYYDGATSITTPPTRGLATRTDVLKDWNSSGPVYLTTSQTGYDSAGRPTSTTDVRGNTTTTSYAFNSGGQISGQTQTNALGWVTTTTVDPATGNTLTSTDPNGRVTAQAYDGLGRLISVWKPGRSQATQSPSISYAYLVRNNAPTVVTTSTLTPSGGYKTTYTLYDGLLRTRQTQAPRADGQSGSVVTDTLYDTAGRTSTVNSPYLTASAPGTSLFVPNQQSDVPQFITTTYDGAGRTIASTTYVNSTGTPAVFAETTTAYGGDRVDVTPPAGKTATSTVTDARGNTVALLQYHGPSPTPFTPGSYDETTYTYNAKDQETQVVDAAGNHYGFTYDLRNRQTGNQDPDSGAITTTYDDAGDVTSTTDARGVTLVYTYDQLGRETGVYQGSVSAANQLTALTYDGLTNSRGQLTKQTTFEQGNAYTVSTLGLTADYQPTAVSYTIPAAETGLAGTYTYVYTYNVDGSLHTTREPSLDGGALASETLTQGFTALGQPDSLATSLPSATTLVPSIQYTGYGEVGTVTLQTNGGAAAYLAENYTPGTRTPAEQQVTLQTAANPVQDNHYSYDASGNPTEISDSVSGDNQCFSYDYLDRLTSAWTPANGDCTAAKSVSALGGPAPYWTDWTYNAGGTRTSQTQHDTPNGTQTTNYTTPPAGSSQAHTVTAASVTDSSGTQNATYAYDQGGNLTSRPDGTGGTETLTWTPQDRVATVTDAGQTTSYVYDTSGNQLIERDSTGKTLYLPGQELRYTTAGATKATTRYYSLDGMTLAMRTTSGVSWLFSDSHGTPDIAVNATTQAVATQLSDPYGNPRTPASGSGSGTGATSGTWPSGMNHGYLGGTKQPTGLINLGAREYDPVTGRFASVDPKIDYDNPQRYDGYAYADDNPMTLSDPAGTSPSDPYDCGSEVSLCVQSVSASKPEWSFPDNQFEISVTVDSLVCQDSGEICLGNDGDWIARSAVGADFYHDIQYYLYFLGPCPGDGYCNPSVAPGKSFDGGGRGGQGGGGGRGGGSGSGGGDNTPTVPTNSPVCGGNTASNSTIGPSTECSLTDMHCLFTNFWQYMTHNETTFETLADVGVAAACVIATDGLCIPAAVAEAALVYTPFNINDEIGVAGGSSQLESNPRALLNLGVSEGVTFACAVYCPEPDAFDPAAFPDYLYNDQGTQYVLQNFGGFAGAYVTSAPMPWMDVQGFMNAVDPPR